MDMNLSKLREIVKERGAWRAGIHGVAELDTTERLNRLNSVIDDSQGYDHGRQRRLCGGRNSWR